MNSNPGLSVTIATNILILAMAKKKTFFFFFIFKEPGFPQNNK